MSPYKDTTLLLQPVRSSKLEVLVPSFEILHQGNLPLSAPALQGQVFSVCLPRGFPRARLATEICISRGSLEKQNQQDVYVQRERFVLRDWLTRLWRLGKSKI